MESKPLSSVGKARLTPLLPLLLWLPTCWLLRLATLRREWWLSRVLTGLRGAEPKSESSKADIMADRCRRGSVETFRVVN